MEGRGGPTQQRASVRPCAVGALLRLDFLVLLGQAKRTKKKIHLDETRNQNKPVFGVELHFMKSEYNFE